MLRLARRLRASACSKPSRALAACALLAAAQVPAWAQDVALTGLMGQRALLVIDGAAPVVVAPGETREGVKLISVTGDQAVIEVQGQRQNLMVGGVPVKLTRPNGSTDGTRIVLTVGSGGHFITSGQINGSRVQFLVDTGATDVSMSASEADRIGLEYQSGIPVLLGTANGNVQGHQIHLTSVRLGEVEIYNVQAIVVQTPMPYVLLGNSFLTHFQLRRENESLILDKRF
jgi:aspartyl protease family protein